MASVVDGLSVEVSSERTVNSNNKTGIKRARPQLSCVPCRSGKLKCNRLHPHCDQCIKRSREDACVYLPPPTKTKQTQNMRGRIRHLESLVVDLMNSKGSPDSNESSTRNNESNGVASVPTNGSNEDYGSASDEEPTKSAVYAFGKMKVSSQEETSYVSGSHWSAILDEIQEVRTFFENEDDVPEDMPYEEDHPEYTDYSSSAINFGLPQRTTKLELIQMLPPKEEADRLTSQWLNSNDPFLYAIHLPTFQEEYKKFWINPQATPVMWIGLLYAALSVSILLLNRGEVVDRNLPSDVYRQAAHFQHMSACAMALGDIGRGNPYTLECMLIYGESEFLKNDEAHLKIWLMAGVLMRLALKMGYHREPSHYGNLSPFRSEMRRRVWLLVYQMDVIVSFAVGLPSLVRSFFSDTKDPSNLFDTDFGPESEELPPPRPWDQLTPGSYGIAKVSLCRVFATATDASHAIDPPPWSEVVALDKQMDKALDELPKPLRMMPLGEALMDRPGVLMCRYNLRLLYLKTRIILHRRYLTSNEADRTPQAIDSQKICLDAAMEILTHQRTIWRACQLGGQLYQVRWYLSSLTAYDFLLASMIVSLELNRWCSTPYTDDIPIETQRATRTETCRDLVDAIQFLHFMWLSPGYRSRNVKRAANFLRTMLIRVRESDLDLEIRIPDSIKFIEAQVDALPATPDLVGDIDVPAQLSAAHDPDSIDSLYSMTAALEPNADMDWTAFDNQTQEAEDWPAGQTMLEGELFQTNSLDEFQPSNIDGLQLFDFDPTQQF